MSAPKSGFSPHDLCCWSIAAAAIHVLIAWHVLVCRPCFQVCGFLIVHVCRWIRSLIAFAFSVVDVLEGLFDGLYSAKFEFVSQYQCPRW